MEYRSQRESLFGNQKAQRQVSGFRVLRQLSLKADLHGTIFAYDYRVRIAYVMTYDHPHTHNFHLGHPQCVVRMSWV